MMIEIDKDVYDDIQKHYDYDGVLKEEWDEEWNRRYYVDDKLLDLYEANLLLIVEQEW